jgi:alpha-D-ribose 1-methylphosphonate 5-triphosphate synthase subunit PhnH
MSAVEVRQHATYTALLWATSYPGRPQRLPVAGLGAFAAIGETLVDLETSFFTPDAELALALTRTGGRTQPPRVAPYQLYPRLTPVEIDLLATAPAGTYADPHLGATLVIGCALGAGHELAIRGPGVVGTLTLRAGGLPAGLWAARTAAGPFPLGWDIYLVSGDQVVGLPRSASVEVH